MMKKGVMLLSVFLLIIASVFIVSAACNDDPHTILRLSSSDNAHGEIYNGPNNYPVRICVNDIFGSQPVPHSHACSGSNKILGLSSNSNAHAQIPSLSTYGIDVCYGNLVCTNRSLACDPGEQCVVTLSSNTNAHLAECNSPNAYDTKICCKVNNGSNPNIPYAYWADNLGDEINQIYVIPGTTSVKMIAKNLTSLNSGDQVTFYVYELDDNSGDDDDNTDDVLRSDSSLTATLDADKNAQAQLTISQQDIINGGNENPLEFYFKVFKSGTDPDASSVLSGVLNVHPLPGGFCDNIDLCSTYTNPDQCNQDPCGVAKTSVESKYDGITCGEHYTDINGCDHWSTCSCKWNTAQGVCEAARDDHVDTSTCGGGGGATGIGECLYHEDTTNDDCSDGFLNYNWTATWTWDTSNDAGSTNPDGSDYVLGNDGHYHYDPLRRSEACVDGGQTIPCPAQVQVPFFGILQLVIAILVIVIIYYFLMNSKKKKPKHVSTKKTINKKSVKKKTSKKKK